MAAASLPGTRRPSPGWPAMVILRGKVAVENGKLSGQPGDGHRVPGKLAAAIQDGPAV